MQSCKRQRNSFERACSMGKKPKILTPDRTDSFHRHEVCQRALAPLFQNLCEQAQAAGWEEREAAYALMVLAAAKLKHDHDRSGDDLGSHRHPRRDWRNRLRARGRRLSSFLRLSQFERHACRRRQGQ
jgi:hypothetical protein